MGTPEVPPKELEAPKPTYTNDSTNNAPGWEIAEEGTTKRRHIHLGLGASATGWAISDRFDRVLSPHRRYFGRSRRTLLIAIGVIILCLLALIIGLAVGLTRKSKDQNLPLPNGAKTYTGDLTYYNPALGACGIPSDDNDAIVAVSHITFDAAQKGSDPNQNPLCGKKIRAQRVNDGKQVSIDVTVVDRCTGCQPTDIDVSPAMFKKMANPDLVHVKFMFPKLPRKNTKDSFRPGIRKSSIRDPVKTGSISEPVRSDFIASRKQTPDPPPPPTPPTKDRGQVQYPEEVYSQDLAEKSDSNSGFNPYQWSRQRPDSLHSVFHDSDPQRTPSIQTGNLAPGVIVTSPEPLSPLRSHPSSQPSSRDAKDTSLKTPSPTHPPENKGHYRITEEGFSDRDWGVLDDIDLRDEDGKHHLKNGAFEDHHEDSASCNQRVTQLEQECDTSFKRDVQDDVQDLLRLYDGPHQTDPMPKTNTIYRAFSGRHRKESQRGTPSSTSQWQYQDQYTEPYQQHQQAHDDAICMGEGCGRSGESKSNWGVRRVYWFMIGIVGLVALIGTILGGIAFIRVQGHDGAIAQLTRTPTLSQTSTKPSSLASALKTGSNIKTVTSMTSHWIHTPTVTAQSPTLPPSNSQPSTSVKPTHPTSQHPSLKMSSQHADSRLTTPLHSTMHEFAAREMILESSHTTKKLSHVPTENPILERGAQPSYGYKRRSNWCCRLYERYMQLFNMLQFIYMLFLGAVAIFVIIVALIAYHKLKHYLDWILNPFEKTWDVVEGFFNNGTEQARKMFSSAAHVVETDFQQVQTNLINAKDDAMSQASALKGEINNFTKSFDEKFDKMGAEMMEQMMKITSLENFLNGKKDQMQSAAGNVGDNAKSLLGISRRDSDEREVEERAWPNTIVITKTWDIPTTCAAITTRDIGDLGGVEPTTASIPEVSVVAMTKRVNDPVQTGDGERNITIPCWLRSIFNAFIRMGSKILDVLKLMSEPAKLVWGLIVTCGFIFIFVVLVWVWAKWVHLGSWLKDPGAMIEAEFKKKMGEVNDKIHGAVKPVEDWFDKIKSVDVLKNVLHDIDVPEIPDIHLRNEHMNITRKFEWRKVSTPLHKIRDLEPLTETSKEAEDKTNALKATTPDTTIPSPTITPAPNLSSPNALIVKSSPNNAYPHLKIPRPFLILAGLARLAHYQINYDSSPHTTTFSTRPSCTTSAIPVHIERTLKRRKSFRPPKTGGSRGGSHSAASRRFHVPLSWKNLRRWVDVFKSGDSTQPLVISTYATPTPTSQGDGDLLENLVSRASTNAAVPRFPKPWEPATDAITVSQTKQEPMAFDILARSSTAPQANWEHIVSALLTSFTASKSAILPTIYPTPPSATAVSSKPSINWEHLASALSAAASSIDSTTTSSTNPQQRQDPGEGRMLTCWEVYSQLRLVIVDLCRTTQHYHNTTSVENPEDNKMAATVNSKICDNFDELLPNVDHGGGCSAKTEWESMKSLGDDICTEKLGDAIVAKSVNHLCQLIEDIEGKIEECEGNESKIPNTALKTEFPDISWMGLAQVTINATSEVLLNDDIAMITSASTPPASIETETASGTSAITGIVARDVITPPSPATMGILSSPAEFILTHRQLGVLPSHPKITPPPEWKVDMITFTKQAGLEDAYTLRTITPNPNNPPPVWTGAHLERTWAEYFPFPIPTGYVAPNIVPKEPQVGHLTFFNGGTGACGLPMMRETELAVAISWVIFDLGKEVGGSVLEDGYDGTVTMGKVTDGTSVLCNRFIRVWMGEGSSRAVQHFIVRDRCTACNVTHIDIQPEVYKKYWGSDPPGKISVTWEWMEAAPTGVP